MLEARPQRSPCRRGTVTMRLWLVVLTALHSNAADHYATLKVPRGAKPDEIKRSYRREALRWHPDKHTGTAAKSQAQQRFEKVNEAFSVLSDPQTRRRYNLELDAERAGFRAGGGGRGGVASGGGPTQTVRVQCSLEQLGGWAPVLIPIPRPGGFFVRTGKLPPGSRPGDTVLLRGVGGVEARGEKTRRAGVETGSSPRSRSAAGGEPVATSRVAAPAAHRCASRLRRETTGRLASRGRATRACRAW